VLLRVVARHPKAVLEAVGGAPNLRLERTGRRPTRRKAS
jgi:hypothetical protein